MWDSDDVGQKYPKSWLPKIAVRSEICRNIILLNKKDRKIEEAKRSRTRRDKKKSVIAPFIKLATL